MSKSLTPANAAEPSPAQESKAPAAAQKTVRFSPFTVRSFWIVLLTTFAVFLIFLSLGRIRLSHSGISLIGSLVYTACIALPSIYLLTRAAERYTERFPRIILLIQSLLLIATSTAGCFVAAAILVFSGIFPHAAYWPEVRWSLPFAITITLIFGLSISTFETLRYQLKDATLQLRTRQVEQERANKLLAEARLSSLESRIHPHFLFNTLNSIAALIPSDPVRAEHTVGNLASLLRFSLNAHHGGMVVLSEEIKILRDYLEIEKTRFGARLRYEIDLPAALDQVKVPPLALQSLAENVVKHVVAERSQGASIRIVGSVAGGRATLEVLDDGPGFSLNAITPEHGLGNLIDRMELLYGPEGRLEVTRAEGMTAVRLSFPA